MKKLLSLVLCIVTMVALTVSPVSATEITESTISDESIAVEFPVSNFNWADSKLAEQVILLIDENGNVYNANSISGRESYSILCEIVFDIYKSGNTYCVTMDGRGRNGYYFTSYVFKIKPDSNGWYEHSYDLTDQPETISDALAFYYPNGDDPDVVNVAVEGSFWMSKGPGILDGGYHPYSGTLTYTN